MKAKSVGRRPKGPASKTPARSPLWKRVLFPRRPLSTRRLLFYTLRIAVLAAFVFYAFAVGLLLLVRFANPPLTALQAQRWVESLGGGDYRHVQRFVPLSRISPHLQHAVIAAEDGGFFAHNGIDWDELENAMEANLKRRKFWRGGSTITQQLDKNLILTTHFSFLRKALEFTLAPLTEMVLSKERILELYLNVIEWGDGIYGAEAASRTYYGLSASQLSREQAARLAACIPAPRRRRPERMDRYAAEILNRMEGRGW